MTKTQDAIAQHLAHSKPEKPVPFLVREGGSMEFVNTYRDKVAQWEVDVLMVMDALAMGGMAGKAFDRGEFLRKIDRQFQEDESCRSGNPPVDDPASSSSI